jgi:hypothetical protein
MGGRWNGLTVERWNGGTVERWNGGTVERWNVATKKGTLGNRMVMSRQR